MADPTQNLYGGVAAKEIPVRSFFFCVGFALAASLVGCGDNSAAEKATSLAAVYAPSAAGAYQGVPASQMTVAPTGLGLTIENETENLIEVTGVDPVWCTPGGCEGLVQRWVLHRGASSPVLAWLIPPRATGHFVYRRGGNGIQLTFTAFSWTDPPTAIGDLVETRDKVGFRDHEMRIRGVVPFR